MAVQSVERFEFSGVPISTSTVAAGVATMMCPAIRVRPAATTIAGVATMVPNASLLPGLGINFIGGGAPQVMNCFEDGSGYTSNLLPVEAWLAAHTLNLPALEQMRRIVLNAITESADPVVQARTLTTTVYMTEIGAIFDDLLTVPDEIRDTMMCHRRRLIVADSMMSNLPALHDAAFNELLSIAVPAPYIELFQRHLTSPQYKRRVAANAAVVLLTALLLYRPS